MQCTFNKHSQQGKRGGTAGSSIIHLPTTIRGRSLSWSVQYVQQETLKESNCVGRTLRDSKRSCKSRKHFQGETLQFPFFDLSCALNSSNRGIHPRIMCDIYFKFREVTRSRDPKPGNSHFWQLKTLYLGDHCFHFVKREIQSESSDLNSSLLPWSGPRPSSCARPRPWERR